MLWNDWLHRMTMGSGNIAIVLSILTLFVLSTIVALDICKLEPKDAIPYSLFSLNGEPLETIGKGIGISTHNDSMECILPLGEIIDMIDFPEYDVIGLFNFQCKSRFRIEIDDENTTKLTNVISYLQLINCILDDKDFDKLGNISDLRVINVIKGDIKTSENQSESSCLGLNKAVSLWIEVEQSPPDLQNILSCQNTFPLMAEVTFTNMAWANLPDYVQDKFPNLQGLELLYNFLTVPPDFPWSGLTMTLPANLSRTPYFQDHYSKAFHLEIPAHIFRRTLVLDNNNITDLSGYTFTGLLHMLSIKSNGLKLIGVNTFSSLRGLQTLLLSFNELSEIPHSALYGLDSLKHLDMRQNNLTYIKIDTFKRLFQLQYLNLANNMLTILQSGLFTHLHNLKELHLEFNGIHTVSRNFIAADSIKLNFVQMNNNPITSLPDVFLLLRKLKKVDLSGTNISFDNFTEFLDNIPNTQYIDSIMFSASESKIDLDRRPDKLREIDLANSQISRIGISYNITLAQSLHLRLLLKNFRLILDNNPLVCDCNIIPFNSYVETLLRNGTLKEDEYFLKSWKCSNPPEFRGRAMLSVKAEESYCKVDVPFCPSVCECSSRHGNEIIIVDCRARGLDELPKQLPRGFLDLWFQQNNISEISDREYLGRIRHLFLSDNQVTHIVNGFFLSTNSLKELKLDGNRLTHMHRDVLELHQTVIHIEHNPFRCDCKTLWMKKWMNDNKFFIQHPSEIVCNTGNDNEEGRQFILVPDEEFICREDFDALRHVVTPSVSSSLCIVLLIVLITSVYCFRTDIKVLLYVYLGFHPFDKDESGHDEVDAIVIHSPDLTEWVLQNIVNPLETCQNKLTVCDISRDFLVGFSFQENISSLVRHSRRLVLCISQSMKADNEVFQISWNAAREKIKESKTNFAIIVSYDVPLKNLQEKEIRKYVRPGRYINKKEKLFKQKLLYAMPYEKRRRNVDAIRHPPGTRAFIESIYGDVNVSNEKAQFDIFISYADRDIPFLLRLLQPELEEKGYRLCIPDRNFMPGAAKEENILGAIGKSRWTLFILSGAHLQDEWSLFVFRAARGKSLREKSNHLVVVVMDETSIDTMDEEIGHYLKTYVSLRSDDKWFWHRLFTAMPLKSVEHLNTNGKTNNTDVNNRFVVLDGIHVVNNVFDHIEE